MELSEIEPTKVCRICVQEKPVKAFDRNPEGRLGRDNRCKLCRKEQDVRYYWKTAYGITQEEYEAKLSEQGGGCAICKLTPEDIGRRLDLDHDHVTGTIRGLLCGTCNRGLGYFMDSAIFLRRAANYMEAQQ